MKIDARGLACPEPVVRTQHAIQSNSDGVEVLVDTMAAVENITRFAKSRRYEVKVQENDGEYMLTLTKAN